MTDSQRVSLRRSAASVLVLGVTWAALLLVLAQGGHAPSFVLLPIAAERYYAFEAAVVVPTLFALWGLMSVTTHVVARALGGGGTLRASAASMGTSWSLPMLGYVVVDAVLYMGGGFAALGLGVRFALPIAGVIALVLAGRALRTVHSVNDGRAYAAAFAGLFLQAIAGAPVLR